MIQPTTNRRDLLRLGTTTAACAMGAAAAANARSANDAPLPAGSGAWDNALRDFRYAEAAADRYWQAIEEPARQDPATRTAAEHAAIHLESDRLGSARDDAEDRLFEVPAPHAAALALKLELLFAEGRDPIPDFQRLVLADAKRLAGVA